MRGMSRFVMSVGLSSRSGDEMVPPQRSWLVIERTVEAVAPHRRRRTASAASLGLAVVALSALLLIGCTAGTPGSSERGSTDPTGTTQEALTTCSVLGASGDAMLSDPPMNGNFGTQPILRAGGKDEGLVRFELGTIPSSAAIDSATLKLYVSGSGSDAPVNLHRATAAWAESTVTYASFGQHFDAAVLGSVLVTSPNVQKSVDVTSLVTGWVTGAQPNFGVLLEANSTSKKTIFVSREGGTAEQKPALQVCYTVPDDHCSPNPCHNGATCENGPSGFVCHCAAGYTDTTCGTNINDCAGSPCQNGGTCTDGLNSYSCACAAGFTGANCGCSTDLQCLALSPLTPFCRGGGRCGGCANDAECNASNPASPVCITSGPRAGACGLCASDSQCRGVNSANPVCGAGGCRACIDDNDCKAFPDATICTPSGSCEATFDACGANPCRNGGVCEDQGETSYACHCLPGYNGVNCETLINNCESQPCLNGAACTNAVNSYVCTCAAGFAGANCEINIDDCAHQPCKNGGTCIDGIRAYTCSCPPDWGGAICDVNLNTCSQTPCLNGSACTNGFGNYTCACAAGFTGTNCEIDINDCAPNPCQNGGVCVDGVNNYTCQCVSGYTGTNCETRSSLLGTLAANPSTAVADGVSATILTLTVTDIGGNPISGQSVVFSSTGVGNHLVTSGVTAANGAVTAALSSTKAETKTVTAAFGGASATADVTFVAGPAAATQSTFVASPSSVAADGVSTTTLTLTVKDTHGNLVGSGQSVFLSSTGSANTFSSVSGVTDAGGVFTSTLSSNEAEVKTVTASSVAGFAKSTSVTFVTACPPDWGGAACDVNLNTCSQNPCLNGSTCANGFGSYTCACAPGFTGTNCEIDINDCAPNPCQHGGICVDGVNAHACTCSAGFTGLDCQDVATCSAAATAIQIFSTSPTTMVGCAGAVISPAAATLCAPTCHVCTSDEWNTNRGVTVPIHNYWTSTLLGYSLNGGACAAIPATSSPPGSCPAGDGFGVCSSMQPDPEGNKCNLTNCGYLTPTPNAYLGGCNQGSSGALCCCP